MRIERSSARLGRAETSSARARDPDCDDARPDRRTRLWSHMHACAHRREAEARAVSGYMAFRFTQWGLPCRPAARWQNVELLVFAASTSATPSTMVSRGITNSTRGESMGEPAVAEETPQRAFLIERIANGGSERKPQARVCLSRRSRTGSASGLRRARLRRWAASARGNDPGIAYPLHQRAKDARQAGFDLG